MLPHKPIDMHSDCTYTPGTSLEGFFVGKWEKADEVYGKDEINAKRRYFFRFEKNAAKKSLEITGLEHSQCVHLINHL